MRSEVTETLTKNITVAFVANHLARKRGTGIARYARELLRAFQNWKESPFHLVPVATWSERKGEDLLNFQERTGLRILATGRWLTPLLWATLKAPKLEQLLDIQIDLVHSNYPGHMVATTKPFLVTIHDLGPLTHPEFFPRRSQWFTRYGLRFAIKRGDGFICVSHATREAFLQYAQDHYFTDLSDRTFVIHEGVAEKFFSPPPNMQEIWATFSQRIRKPFILFVGKISPRKNLPVVLRALAKLKDKIPHHLVCAGSGWWNYENVMTLARRFGVSDRVHFLGHVSEDQLLTLYHQASIFVFPSLLEGFGLPVLEAMAAGCPVVASNQSSIPEVAEDAALLLDPHNVEEWADAMVGLWSDPSLAQRMRKRGIQRAKRFSWAKSVRELSRIYEQFV